MISTMSCTDLLLYFFLILASWQQVCQATQLQYSNRFMSNKKGDGFAHSLASIRRTVFISAAQENKGKGSVRSFIAGGKLTPPEGFSFNEHIDANEHFLVVGGKDPAAVHVYSSSSSPLKFNGSISLGRHDKVMNVKITENNTIMVVVAEHNEQHNRHCFVFLYKHNKKGLLHLFQVLQLGKCRASTVIGLAVNESFLAVELFREEVSLRIYKKVKRTWVPHQTLKPSLANVLLFGKYMSLEGDQLALTAVHDEKALTAAHDDIKAIVFVYHFDHVSDAWKPGTTLFPAGIGGTPAINKDILVVTINDWDQPDVSGLVYRLSKSTNTSDTTQVWKQVATLRTFGDPSSGHMNWPVCIEGGLVYTGRVVGDGIDEVGRVFLHYLWGLDDKMDSYISTLMEYYT